MKRLFYIILLSFLTTYQVNAQNNDILFNHFPTIGVLAEARINSIYQDSLGFVWMATNQGLVKFDGSNVKEYKRQNIDAQKGKLGSNCIYSIRRADHESVWLRTEDGIVVFNPENESFLPLELTWNGQKLQDISSMQLGTNGHALLKTRSGIFDFDTQTHELVHLNTTLENKPDIEVSAICLDRHNSIWLGISNRGICRYDKNRHTARLIGSNPHVPIIISDYSADSLIFGTINHGVFIMSKRTGVSRKVAIPDKADDNIFATSFCMVSDQELWISSESGIYILHNGKIIHHLQHSSSDPFSLSSNKVTTLWLDQHGGIWAGTRNAGINYYSPSANKIHLYYPCNRFPGFLGTRITSLAEDNEGNVWSGSEDEGLFCRMTDGTVKHFTIATLPQLHANHITCLRMRNEELWVGTYTGGLSVFNMRSGLWRHYEKTPEEGSLKNNEDNCLLVDDEGRMWIGTTTHLFLYDEQKDCFILTEGIREWINDIIDDHEGNLWLATSHGGLICYRKCDGQVFTYTHQPKSSSSLCFGTLSCLHLDVDGKLWIGSNEDGLCVLDRKRRQFHHIDSSNGLAGGMICAMISDDDGSIWISTTEGVSKVDRESLNVLQTLHNRQGLLNRQFYPRACMKAHNGELFWGSTNGYIAFYPEDIEQQQRTFSPVATEVSFTQDKHGTLERFNGRLRLTLPYSESAFRTILSARDYERENTGIFQYRLDGFEKEWQTCDGHPVVSYNQLPPGQYTLYARYSTDGLTWSEDVTIMEVKVLPPWWGTWWAFILYILLLGAIAFWAFHYARQSRIKAIAKQRDIWESQRKEESMKARIDFFTNVAHEIRTPVSLIKLSVEQMKDTRGKVKGMDVLNRNVKRLTELVNELLEFRRWEASALPLNSQILDLGHLVKITTETFAPTFEKKKVDVCLQDMKSAIQVRADEKALSTILTNLVGNAAKYCNHHIDIRVEEQDGRAIVEVENDGTPVPTEIRKRLFEPFVKGEGNQMSTGLGLSLVKLLADKIGATVHFCGTDEQTIFTLSLPLYSADTDIYQKSDLRDAPVSDKENETTACILVVEDNDDLRNFLQERLSEHYHVLTSIDGQDAWNLLQGQDVDVVVSDVMMPKMDGFELCGKIKSQITTCHIPVVLLTARTTEPDHIKGLKIGADAYMDKPFSAQQLLAQIESIILNRRLQHKRWLSLVAQTDTQSGVEESRAEIFTNPIDQQFHQQLNEFIDSHMSDDEFNIDLLAQYMNMSRSNFHRKMKALFGTTPGDYVFMVRMQRAAALLSEGRLRVGEVAAEVGFQSVAHFSRTFLKQYGVQPSNYASSVHRPDGQSNS